MRITPGDIRTQTKTKEANSQPTKSIQPTTPFLARMIPRGYRQMAGQLRPTSIWPPMTSHYHQTDQSPPHWSAMICSSSSASTQNCPRLMGLVEPTSTSRKRTGLMLKPATITMQKLETQKLSNKPRRPAAEKTCSKAVNKARGLFILAGRIRHFQPTMPALAESLDDEPDRNRRLNHADDLNK